MKSDDPRILKVSKVLIDLGYYPSQKTLQHKASQPYYPFQSTLPTAPRGYHSQLKLLESTDKYFTNSPSNICIENQCINFFWVVLSWKDSDGKPYLSNTNLPPHNEYIQTDVRSVALKSHR